MEVCKTDMQKIIKYLDDAARMYDNHPGQRNVCRAWVIRQLIKKLNKKLVVTSKYSNMRIYFDIIFVVLNVILFALNFHFALESKSSKSYTYAILGMTFAIAAIVLLLSTDSNQE